MLKRNNLSLKEVGHLVDLFFSKILTFFLAMSKKVRIFALDLGRR